MENKKKATKPANPAPAPAPANLAPAVAPVATPLDMVVREYGNGLAEYTLEVIDAKGAKHSTALSGDNARMMIASDEVHRIGKKLDLSICLLFGALDRANKETKKGVFTYGASTRDIIMQKYKYAKSTANSYLSIGKTFFTNAGTEKVLGISSFTVGQIIPFLAVAKDYSVVGGLETDHDTFEWLIANDYLSPDMGAKELSDIASMWRDGHFPKEWVKESASGEYPYYIPSTYTTAESIAHAPKESFVSDLEFTSCPFLETVSGPDDNAPDDNAPDDKAPATDDAPATDTPQISLFASILKVLSVVDDMPVSEDLRSEWANVKEQVLIVAKKIDDYKPATDEK